jgi:hypothetical protein
MHLEQAVSNPRLWLTMRALPQASLPLEEIDHPINSLLCGRRRARSRTLSLAALLTLQGPGRSGHERQLPRALLLLLLLQTIDHSPAGWRANGHDCRLRIAYIRFAPTLPWLPLRRSRWPGHSSLLRSLSLANGAPLSPHLL